MAVGYELQELWQVQTPYLVVENHDQHHPGYYSEHLGINQSPAKKIPPFVIIHKYEAAEAMAGMESFLVLSTVGQSFSLMLFRLDPSLSTACS